MAPNAPVIPANLPGFAYSATNATTNDVHLYAVQNGNKTEVPLSLGPVADRMLKVAPTNPLTPGTAYELDYQPFCDYSPYPSGPLNFTASPAAPLPTSIGDVTSGPTFTSTPGYAFHLEVSYALADAMKPWASVYVISAWADGGIAGSTAPKIDVQAGTITLVTDGICSLLAPNTLTHAVTLRASLPFAPQLETAGATATLDCPLRPGPPPGAPPGTTVVVTDQNNTNKSGCAFVARRGADGGSMFAWGALAAAGLLLMRRRSSTAAKRGR